MFPCRSINVTPPSTPSGPRAARMVNVAAVEEGDEENAGGGGGRRSKRIAGGGRRGHPPTKRGRGGR